MITHSNLSKMKDKTLPTCLQGNYRDSLGEFSNTSPWHGVFGVERVNTKLETLLNYSTRSCIPVYRTI